MTLLHKEEDHRIVVPAHYHYDGKKITGPILSNYSIAGKEY